MSATPSTWISESRIVSTVIRVELLLTYRVRCHSGSPLCGFTPRTETPRAVDGAGSPKDLFHLTMSMKDFPHRYFRRPIVRLTSLIPRMGAEHSARYRQCCCGGECQTPRDYGSDRAPVDLQTNCG